MTSPFDDPNGRFNVLINEEEQYSLWPELLDIPAGWTSVAVGDIEECSAYVDKHWTDMRPRSLRIAMTSGTGR
jgi:MbtH protein